MHSLDVVHRDLKAENLVFTAKGSPLIKFIDFGGASAWTAEEGLSGLVGTPQYVAPEVVTGFGDDRPTEQPYGKECDLWSMGVLLYVSSNTGPTAHAVTRIYAHFTGSIITITTRIV